MQRRSWLLLAAATVATAVVAPPLARRLRHEDVGADDPVTIPPGARVHRLTMADGGLLHVVDCGPLAARPLVLLHGITLGAEAWGYQLRDLAGPFRVVAPDLRGHGESTAGADGYGVGPIAADVAALLEQLDLRDAVVVGHSMGGMALQRACADHGDVLRERAAGLVFLSTSLGAPLPPVAQRAVDALSRRAARLGSTRLWQTGGKLPPGPAGTAATSLVFGPRPAAGHVQATERWVRAMEPEASWLTGLSLGSHAGGEALRSWTGPALVVVGSHDLVTPVRLARRIVAALTDVHLEVVEGAGHMIMLERPQELARLLTSFAARLPVRPAAP